MSFRTLFTASLAAFAPLVAAYTAPKGDPSGNAIYEPGLNSIVPVGKPFSITWQPTTQGKISLVLLHGPSTNVVPIKTIVEDIDNTGSYDWTPPTDLAPNKTYYGIQLIVEGTGQYQYSTQFGISNDNYKVDDSNTMSSASATTTPIVNIKGPVTSASSAIANASSSVASVISSVSSSAVASASSAASSSVSRSAAASKSMNSSASRTASGSSSGTSGAASQTGAAGKVGAAAGFGRVAFVAGVVAVVL